jgi:hypothetical protein
MEAGCIFFEKLLPFDKIALPLHPQIDDGGIAQLVRAHDS